MSNAVEVSGITGFQPSESAVGNEAEKLQAIIMNHVVSFLIWISHIFGEIGQKIEFKKSINIRLYSLPGRILLVT